MNSSSSAPSPGSARPRPVGLKYAACAWVAASALLLGYEAWALASGTPDSTLSEEVWSINRKTPMLGFAAGFVMGHFFWQKARG